MKQNNQLLTDCRLIYNILFVMPLFLKITQFYLDKSINLSILHNYLGYLYSHNVIAIKSNNKLRYFIRFQCIWMEFLNFFLDDCLCHSRFFADKRQMNVLSIINHCIKNVFFFKFILFMQF